MSAYLVPTLCMEGAMHTLGWDPWGISSFVGAHMRTTYGHPIHPRQTSFTP